MTRKRKGTPSGKNKAAVGAPALRKKPPTPEESAGAERSVRVPGERLGFAPYGGTQTGQRQPEEQSPISPDTKVVDLTVGEFLRLLAVRFR